MSNEFKNIAMQAPSFIHCQKDQNLEPGAIYGPVIRDHFIFECCTSGYGSVIINGKEFNVKPGDFYVLFPGDTVKHTADTYQPRSGYSCAVKGLELLPYLERAGINSTQPFAHENAYNDAYVQMQELYKNNKDTDPGAEYRCLACFYRILGSIYKRSDVTNKDVVIQKAIAMMESAYGKNITTQDIAEYVGLDRSYFSSFFKAQTGTPPHRYLTNLRIQKACALIKRNDISISLVAESVGIDPQNFSRTFKREIGITPREYRNNKK